MNSKDITVAGDSLIAGAEGGEIAVLKAGRELEVVNKNKLDKLRSTPAIVGDRLYLRTMRCTASIRTNRKRQIKPRARLLRARTGVAPEEGGSVISHLSTVFRKMPHRKKDNEPEPLKLDRSKELLARSDELIVPGCLVHKRNHDMLEKGYPVYVERAEGANFWDVDGNKYIDYLMGFGPIVLGHAHPAVTEAIEKQIRDGIVYSVGNPLEIELAERILSHIPWAGRLAFMIGGSGATSGAIRLMRAVTGRDLVLRCGYHGWHDWTSPKPGGVPPTCRALSIEFPYNDLEALEDLLKRHSGRVAGIIVETLRFDGPDPDFLQECIDLAHWYDALCTFDEVKTGCRVDIGGMNVRMDLEPDLATYGKAWGNGLPASFIVGSEEVMTREAAQNAWIAATFHADTLSLVAIRTVLDELEAQGGIAHQWKLGKRMMDGVNAVCEEAGIGYRLKGWPPMPNPKTDEEDKERVLDMLRGCLARGIYLHPGHAMFLSLAHTEDDIDYTIAAVEDSLK